jgi:peptide/nickel transport system ATP-binding protein
MHSSEQVFAHPLHPYTQMLMASVPRLDKKWDKTEVEPKAQTSAPGAGCVHFDRCPIADQACTRERPPLLEAERDHFVACIRYNKG